MKYPEGVSKNFYESQPGEWISYSVKSVKFQENKVMPTYTYQHPIVYAGVHLESKMGPV